MISRKAFSVHMRTSSECLADLPILTKIQTARRVFDFLIVAAGFEERVMAVPNHFLSEGTRIEGGTLVARYRTNVYDNDQRYKQLEPLLSELGATLTCLQADDPIRVVADVSKAIDCAEHDQLRVAFDISGASSTLILSVMAALCESKKKIALTLFYATARTYDMPRGDAPEALVLSSQRESGVSAQPLSVPFAGHHHDHLPTSVVAIPSLYTGRLEACLAHLNVGPITGSEDNLYWIFPSTSNNEHKWRHEHTYTAVLGLIKRLQGLEDDALSENLIRADDMSSCDVLDYAAMLRLLIDRIDSLSGRNISIVHMGSKLQAIGVALAASARTEAAVLTVRPASFNAATYSSGIGDIYFVDFPDLEATLKSVGSIGKLEVSSP